MRYSILGLTGLRVSAVALGTGNFGTGWGHGADRAEARAMFEAYRAVHAAGVSECDAEVDLHLLAADTKIIQRHMIVAVEGADAQFAPAIKRLVKIIDNM